MSVSGEDCSVADCNSQRWWQRYLPCYMFFIQCDSDILSIEGWSLCPFHLKSGRIFFQTIQYDESNIKWLLRLAHNKWFSFCLSCLNSFTLMAFRFGVKSTAVSRSLSCEQAQPISWRLHGESLETQTHTYIRARNTHTHTSSPQLFHSSTVSAHHVLLKPLEIWLWARITQLLLSRILIPPKLLENKMTVVTLSLNLSLNFRVICFKEMYNQNT